MASFLPLILTVSLASGLVDPVIESLEWDPRVTSFLGAWTNPCAKSPLKGTPTCDASKSFEERAHDLVYNQEAKLSDAFTAYQGLTGNGAQSVSALNIPGYQWWSEALQLRPL